jgi:hypothetical protein
MQRMDLSEAAGPQTDGLRRLGGWELEVEREKTMTKKRFGGGAASLALLLGMFAPPAKAATPSGSLTILVTVNASLSINLSGPTTYNFGTIAPAAVVASTAAIVVTNDSSGLVEDYTITSSTFIATGGTNWNISGTLTAAQDVFALGAAISPSAMTVSSFTTSMALPVTQTGSATYMNTSQFGTGGLSGANTNGDHVASAATRNLWIYFAAPTGITSGDGAQQSATVTLTANAASLFP